MRLAGIGAVVVVVGLVICGGGAGAAWGGESYTTVSEEMKVAVELEMGAPAAYYDFDGKTLSWREVAAGDSHYLRVTVRDLVSSGPVAGATVNGAIMSLKDKVIGTSITLHETWDRERAHYGANLQLEAELTSGNVALRILPGKGRRLGREDGDFFTKPVTVKFDGVDFGRAKAAGTITGLEEGTSAPAKIDWPKGRRPYVAPTPYPGANPDGVRNPVDAKIF